jgi:hypothetical protein
MAQDTKKGAQPKPKAQSREDRLKAALKANMARRKAQARARTVADETTGARSGAGDKTNPRGGADAHNTDVHAEKSADD